MLELRATETDEDEALEVDPQQQPLDYNPKTWRTFVERARDRVDGGSLGAAVNAAATGKGRSDSDRAQLASYVATEIENEQAANADQLSATTFDKGRYTGGDQDAVTSGYDALPRLLANLLQIVLNTPVTAIARRDNSVIVPAGNQSLEGPAAIVAVPLGVLKSDAIPSTRPCPRDTHPRGECTRIRRAVQELLPLQPANLERRERFLPIHRHRSGVWSQWFTSPSAAGPIVLAFDTGDRGRSVESSNPSDLMSSALPIARQLFGDNISPVEVRTSNWTVGRYARGAYSFHAPVPPSTTRAGCRNQSATGSTWRVRPSASTTRPL